MPPTYTSKECTHRASIPIEHFKRDTLPIQAHKQTHNSVIKSSMSCRSAWMSWWTKGTSDTHKEADRRKEIKYICSSSHSIADSRQEERGISQVSKPKTTISNYKPARARILLRTVEISCADILPGLSILNIRLTAEVCMIIYTDEADPLCSVRVCLISGNEPNYWQGLTP